MSFHRGSYQGFRRGKLSRAETLPPQPFGPVIDSINIKTLMIEEDAPTIKDVEYVASYNWLDGKHPIILVPGSPPKWAPPAEDTELRPDSENVFRDINAARYASYPIEPIFRALQVMQPHNNLQSVDIVGCGSTIGNLLRFAGSHSKPFRFDVDVIGDAVLFVRKERSPTELITDLHGYGHTFPESYTTWDSEVRNSCSHQRIVQYDFGGLKLLVRTETDGYVKDPSLSKPIVSKPASQPFLDDALKSISVSTSAVDSDQGLQVRLQGTKIPQNKIFDIKTRASHRPFDMEEILPRLWVNQTYNFLIAYHNHGLFEDPEVKNVKQLVLGWESTNSAKLARFHALLTRIVDVVRDSENQQCEVSWDGEGPLRITKQVGEGRRALPNDLVRLLED